MDTWEWIVGAALAVAAVLLLLALVRVRTRRHRLKERFGGEYYRAVSNAGTGGAEKQLSEIEREREELDIRSLPSLTRDRYLDEWRQAEARFVSDPREAVRTAERIVERALEERGYPLEDDTQRRATLVAIDHPDIAERYRHGHAMLESVDGAESTETLRKAMVDFRAVLEDVLQGERTAVG